MESLQECLTWLEDAGYSPRAIRLAREELAEVTQKASRLCIDSADVERAATLAWNEAVEKAANVLLDCGLLGNTESKHDVMQRIRALKRTP